MDSRIAQFYALIEYRRVHGERALSFQGVASSNIFMVVSTCIQVVLTCIIARSAYVQARNGTNMANITIKAEKRRLERLTPRIMFTLFHSSKKVGLNLVNISDIAVTIISFELQTGVPLDSKPGFISCAVPLELEYYVMKKRRSCLPPYRPGKLWL